MGLDRADAPANAKVWEGETLVAEAEDERVEACFLPKSLAGLHGMVGFFLLFFPVRPAGGHVIS